MFASHMSVRFGPISSRTASTRARSSARLALPSLIFTAVCPAASREKYLQLRMAARNTKEAFSVIPDEEAALREQYRKRAELAHSPFEEQEEMAQWVLDTCQHAAAAAALDAVGFHKFELHEMPQSYQDQVLGKNLQKKSKKRKKKGSRRNAYRTEL